MKTIWKWTLNRPHMQLSMPSGAHILDVQMQNGTPVLWALCDPDVTRENRTFVIYGTGRNMPTYPGKYISTFQHDSFVWHVFEQDWERGAWEA
jgi:hypothetical protein